MGALLLLGLIRPGHAADPIREVVLDDFSQLGRWRAFEEPPDIEKEQPSNRRVVFSISDEWASRGTTSLKIEGPAFVPGQTSAWPGVVLRNTAIPVRDWRPYNFMTVDLKITSPDTKILILIQRGPLRHRRARVIQTFDVGEYRIWVNIPEYISGGNVEHLNDISSVEFLPYQPKEDKTFYVDNFRLVNAFTPHRQERDVLGVPDSQWQHIEAGLRVPPPNPPRVTWIEPLSFDGHLLRQGDARRLKRVERAAGDWSANAQADLRLATDYPDADHGAYVVPVDERVRFVGQAVGPRWERQLTLAMGQGEVRSRQLALVRPYGTTVDRVSLKISDLVDADRGNRLPASVIEPELVGYVFLPDHQEFESKGMRPGWHADPVLAWQGGIDLDEQRQMQPILITVRVPRDAEPGRYTGTLVTSSEHQGRAGTRVEIPVAIEVLPFVFPVKPSLQTLVSTGPYGDVDPSFFLAHRMSPNSHRIGAIYLRGNAPAVDTDLVERMAAGGMTNFNLHQAHELEIFGQRESKTDLELAKWFADRLSQLYPEAFWRRMLDAGIADRAVVYGFDESDLRYERNRDTIRAVFQEVKNRFGKYGVRIATTAQFLEKSYLDFPVDIWIPTLNRYDPDFAEEGRRRGIETWIYTMDWEIWRPLVWSRVLPWSAFQLQAEGWLYYDLSGWPQAMSRSLGEHPLTDWDPVSYPDLGSYGMGGLVYRDSEGLRSSLRLVNFREGMYDHDLLVAVRKLIDAAGEKSVSDRAGALIEQARSQLLLDFAKSYGGEHEGMSHSVGLWLERWREQCLRLVAENGTPE